jgi:hypothetical protein
MWGGADLATGRAIGCRGAGGAGPAAAGRPAPAARTQGVPWQMGVGVFGPRGYVRGHLAASQRLGFGGAAGGPRRRGGGCCCLAGRDAAAAPRGPAGVTGFARLSGGASDQGGKGRRGTGFWGRPAAGPPGVGDGTGRNGGASARAGAGRRAAQAGSDSDPEARGGRGLGATMDEGGAHIWGWPAAPRARAMRGAGGRARGAAARWVTFAPRGRGHAARRPRAHALACAPWPAAPGPGPRVPVRRRAGAGGRRGQGARARGAGEGAAAPAGPRVCGVADSKAQDGERGLGSKRDTTRGKDLSRGVTRIQGVAKSKGEMRGTRGFGRRARAAPRMGAAAGAAAAGSRAKKRRRAQALAWTRRGGGFCRGGPPPPAGAGGRAVRAGRRRRRGQLRPRGRPRSGRPVAARRSLLHEAAHRQQRGPRC